MRIFGHDRDTQEQTKSRGGLGLGTLALAGVAAVLLYEPARRASARFIHQQIENLLSLILGADVRFERLRASLLNGSFEAEGMSVTRKGMDQPLFTVDRVEADAALSHLLHGELLIESLVLHRPVLRVVRQVDRHTNVPSRLQVDPAEAPQKANRALEITERVGQTMDKLGLRFGIGRALAMDGELHFEDHTAEGYHVAARGITEELVRTQAGYDYTAIISSIGRLDQPGELGEVRVNGRIENIADLTQIARARIWSQVAITEDLQMVVDVPSVESRKVIMMIDGTADLARIHPLLPPGVHALEPLRALSTQGRVALRTTLAFDPHQGLTLSDVTGGTETASGQSAL